MNWVWRIVLYATLAGLTAFCAQRFFAGLSHEMERAAERYERHELTRPEPAEVPRAAVPSTPEADDAAPPPAATHASDAAFESPPPPETNQTNVPVAGTASSRPTRESVARSKGWYGALALAGAIALGLLVGRDVSNYLAHRAHREIYGEASEPIGDPEYDEAERIWANGDHLEAIRRLRDFLNHKPTKLHAAFRIAEIYEKDLKNPLAAALEYETILRHRFEPERWGWAAIHLVNLYNRIGQAPKAEALLRRLVEEYPQTAAAAKARERLGQPETPPSDQEPSPPADGQFHLPRGFKPKRG